MFLRITIFIMIAVGLLGFGAVTWMSMGPPARAVEAARHPRPQPPVFDTILVAAADLRPGSLLKPSDIGSLRVLRATMPTGAVLDTISDRQRLVGSMVRRHFFAKEALTNDALLRPGDHGFLAAVLKAGMRAVTVGVDAISGTAGLIWPGDHVDVVLTHEIKDPSRPIGQQLAAETVLSNVRVIAIDQQLMQGARLGGAQYKTATTVTLEVTEAEAERVTVATRLGHLSLLVRSATATSTATRHTAPPAITWASDVSPALDAAGAAAANVVKVFGAAGKGQEYHF